MRTLLAHGLGCLALAAPLWPAAAGAQIDTGTIVGRVQDTTGAVLPGVTVTADRIGTGVTASTVTNDSGRVRLPRPAHRRLRREPPSSPGFKQGQLQGGASSASRTACEVDFALGRRRDQRGGDGHRPARAAADADRPTSATSSTSGRCATCRCSAAATRSWRSWRPASSSAPAGHHRAAARTRSSTPTATSPPGTTTRSTAPTTTRSRPTCRSGARRWCSRRSTRCEEFKVQTRTYSAEFGKAAGAVDQRLDQAGHQRVPRHGLRVLPRRGVQRQHLGQQPRRPAEGQVQPAHRRRHAGRADRRATSTFFFGDYQAHAHRAARCRRPPPCRRR